MAELLVRVADKTTAEDPRALLFLRAGEVVVVCPDGWPWSEAEQTNPDWVILKLPNVTESEASAMLGPDREFPGSGKLSLRRAFAFTPAQLAVLQANAASATWADLYGNRTRRSVPNDPNVLGSSRRIIG